jgi:hypothetical protein
MDAEKFYGDVLYDVWHAGKNIDLVDRDRVAQYQADGLDAEQAADNEIRRQRRAREHAAEEA